MEVYHVKEENISDAFGSNVKVLSTPSRKRRRASSANSSLEESSDDSDMDESNDEDSNDDNVEEEGTEPNIQGESVEADIQEEDMESEIDGWTRTGEPRPFFPFLSQPGLTFEEPEQKECLYFIEKFIDDDLISLIVEQTNKYAQRFFEKSPSLKPRSRCRAWVETNDREIRVFICLLILQGIIRKPSYGLYFRRHGCLETPFFYKTMTEKRFLLLVKFLYFADNSSFDPTLGNRKTYKIDPVLDYLRNKFKKLYVPQKQVLIHESVMLWKRKFIPRNDIPSRKSQSGIKLYMMCEAKSGYICDFLIRRGQDKQYGSTDPEKKVEKVANRIVLELCHELMDKGYLLYLDSKYTTVELVEKLCERNIDVVGTMRRDRKGIPVDIGTRSVKRGTFIARYKGKMMIMKWKDQKDVIIMSTVHDSKFVKTEKLGKATTKPEVIVDYNKNMGGVDVADGQMKTYQIARSRVKNYYYKIFLHSLDMICLNAYLLYSKAGGNLDRLHFLTEIVEKGVEKYGDGIQSTSSSMGRPSLKPKPTRLTERHFPDYIFSITSLSNVSRRCKLCYSRGIRKETRFWCSDCKVALCVPNCFKEYHTVKQ